VFVLFPVQSQAQTLKRKAAFNLNWKFFQGTPTGTPSASSYSDASWQSVSVPHSASYDAPAWSSEINYYQGDCWYRKTFTVPANAKKVFLEFEGAMQTATVWINGTQTGIHDNSGYTPFYFDISNSLVRGASNVVAIKLNNQKSPNIPPGGSSPDFCLFGGLYRSVWLQFKDSVYVPIYTQQIQTEHVSAASAQIHARTAVKNDAAAAKSVQVVVTLIDAANASVVSQTATQTIPSGVLDTFDMMTAAFSSPHLWSPSSPYMYSVQTLVSVNGATVDSVVEPCGIRWFTWSTQGFFINGSRFPIKGMCVHQFEGWIGNAVDLSRYFQEIKMLKNLGCNSVRCSHYPRAQAFYDACDRLGMLLYVEQPSWGWGVTPVAACWTRMDSCAKEMVLSGRNHPSIYAWGLYNEPVPDPYVDFSPSITTINNVVHGLDTTRLTSMANINNSYAPNGWNQAITIPDIAGLNYSNSISFSGTTAKPWLNTESRTGFYYVSSRGSALDLDTTSTTPGTGTAGDEWGCMAYTLNTTGHLAGGHFWCFKDYNSPDNTTGFEGIVDRLTVPKTVFYMFRQNWAGIAPDYPRPGTATKIDFQTDTTTLNATGSDIFLLTATMRDANNRQISTATGNVTFTVNPAGAGTIFGGNTVAALAGRAGAFLRTTTTASTITVTAAYAGLPSATLTLTTTAVTESYTEGPVSIHSPLSQDLWNDANTLKIFSSAKGYAFRCPKEPGRLSIMDCMGRTLYSMDVAKGASPVIDRKTFGTGLFYGVWKSENRRLISKISMVSQ
jgi:Beta-galactosidase/beta-glucuronidase